LEKAKEPLSRSEIAKSIGCEPKTVSMRLKVLIKFHEVNSIEIPREEAMRRFRSKRRMNLYYLEGKFK
jgi:hypothetical protein